MAVTERVPGDHLPGRGGFLSTLAATVPWRRSGGPGVGPSGPAGPRAAHRRVRSSAWTRALEVVALTGTGTALVAVALVAIDVSARFTHPTSFSIGAQSAAVLGFLLSTTLLAVRWRLLGDTSAGALALTGILIGVVIVPTLAPVPTEARAFVAVLRLSTVALAVCIMVLAIRSSAPGPRTHPAAVATLVLALPFAIAVPVGISPVAGALSGHPSAFIGTSAVESLLAVTGALVLLRVAVRTHRLLDAAAVILLVLLAGTMAVRTSDLSARHTTGSIAAVVLQLCGAALLLVVALTETVMTLRQVAGIEVRIRRRAEMIESRLVHTQRRQEGKEHDIRSSLGAVDGALHLLQLHAGTLRGDQDRDLLAATRGQIHSIQRLLRDGEGALTRYPLSEILSDLVVLRAASQEISTSITPGLQVVGNAPVLMLVINDLLDNAATHAPGAAVALRARRATGGREGYAEVEVCDDGPGMDASEIRQAFQPGWRSSRSAVVAGSGIGLSRCRELIDGQGGTITLGCTHLGAPPEHRGLRATVWVPLAPAATTWTPPDGTLHSTRNEELLRQGDRGDLCRDPELGEHGLDVAANGRHRQLQ